MPIEEIYPNRTAPYPLDFLLDLELAIGNVNQRYCGWHSQRGNVSQKIERVFAYELYHQLRIQLNARNPENEFRFDGEIQKSIQTELDYCGVTPALLDKYVLDRNSNRRLIRFRDQRKFSPDLVIHLCQTNRLPENQLLIVEIKTNQRTLDSALAKDILKLNHFIQNLNFQYGVLISVNSEFTNLKNQIQAIFPRTGNVDLLERFRRIVIFNYCNENLESTNLFNILENII